MSEPVLDLAKAAQMAALAFRAYLAPSNESAMPYRDRYKDDTRVYYQDMEFVKMNFAYLVEVQVGHLSGITQARPSSYLFSLPCGRVQRLDFRPGWWSHLSNSM
jgi:hypothetical protein